MFNNAKYYFNRELSWLKFNQRVLLESIDTNTPLLGTTPILLPLLALI